MPINRAKAFGDLYADITDYDLVLVPGAAARSAINRRFEQAHFGPFAITPRRLSVG